MDNKCIDVKNVNYDFDITKEFTWDFRELVEIKKRKRIVEKMYKPTMKTLGKISNAKAFEQSRKEGRLFTKLKPYTGYETYEYISDIHADDDVKAKQDK